jgi:hypothetical protein
MVAAVPVQELGNRHLTKIYLAKGDHAPVLFINRAGMRSDNPAQHRPILLAVAAGDRLAQRSTGNLGDGQPQAALGREVQCVAQILERILG